MSIPTTTDQKPRTVTDKSFRFKQFEVQQDRCTMKVGTDGVLLGAWADVTGAGNILDIGTGTGVIAMMLAQRADNNARIDAVDIEQNAAEQAAENVARCAWADRIHVHHQDIKKFARLSRTDYDLIVSNPPFFSGGVLSENQDRNSVRHTVKLAHGDLLMAVQKLLAKTGKFCVILPNIEGRRLRELSEQYHLHCTRTTEVYPKADKSVERLLLQFEREARAERTDRLVIQHDARNDWTEQYIELTGDYYLNM